MIKLYNLNVPSQLPLFGVTVLLYQSAPAQADILVDNTNGVSPAILTAGENLTVTGTGTISAAYGAVINNVTAGAVINQGTIQGSSGVALYINNGSTINGGITNGGAGLKFEATNNWTVSAGYAF